MSVLKYFPNFSRKRAWEATWYDTTVNRSALFDAVWRIIILHLFLEKELNPRKWLLIHQDCFWCWCNYWLNIRRVAFCRFRAIIDRCLIPIWPRIPTIKGLYDLKKKKTSIPEVLLLSKKRNTDHQSSFFGTTPQGHLLKDSVQLFQNNL